MEKITEFRLLLAGYSDICQVCVPVSLHDAAREANPFRRAQRSLATLWST